VDRRSPRRRRLQPEERQAEIVAAAHRVIAGRDPTEVTFEEIARAAGVSRALLYSYFGDRGSLLAAVYEDLVGPLDANLEVALRSEASSHARLHRLVEDLVLTAQTRPGLWHAITVLAAVRHPAIQAARMARLERLAGAWGGTESRLVISGLLGLLEAAVTNWLAEPDLPPEQLIALVEDLAWSGFGPRQALTA
jgi:AcrR family transcriptional regulator